MWFQEWILVVTRYYTIRSLRIYSVKSNVLCKYAKNVSCYFCKLPEGIKSCEWLQTIFPCILFALAIHQPSTFTYQKNAGLISYKLITIALLRNMAYTLFPQCNTWQLSPRQMTENTPPGFAQFVHPALFFPVS